MHLFLSPHFDDAVYSCGGTIYQLAQAGETVRVYTVMGAMPPDILPDTPIVQELHERWQSGDSPVTIRRREDEEALHGLNAEAAYNSVIPDCVYRLSGDNTPLYPDEASIFGDVKRADPALRHLANKIPSAANLWQRIEFNEISGEMRFVQEDVPDVTLYAPLTVGHHVDHLVVRDWALALKDTYPYLKLKFYGDFPYIRQADLVQPVLDAFEITLTPEMVYLTNDAVQAKIRAVAAYQSQLSTFWDSDDAMRADVEGVLRQTGGGEPAEQYYRAAHPYARP